MHEYGLDKLTFYSFKEDYEPFMVEEEVISRLANICPRLNHLEIKGMSYMSESGKMSLVSLFRQIIQHNPPI